MTDPRDRAPAMTSPATTSEPVVTLEDTSFSYGSSIVLAGITGRVPAGQASAFVGLDGSDETTLVWALFDMVTVSRGRVRVNRAAPGRAPRGFVGYVPQLSDLDPTFSVTVREVIQMGAYSQLGILRHPGAKARCQALEALKSMGLIDRAEQRFDALSGGQQQRILVTRCVAARPRLILLDEPFNGPNQPSRKALLSIITPLKDQGISLVISTYDLVLAQGTCKQAVLLARRQIIFGPHDGVFVTHYIDEARDGHGTTRLLGLRLGAGTQEPP